MKRSTRSVAASAPATTAEAAIDTASSGISSGDLPVPSAISRWTWSRRARCALRRAALPIAAASIAAASTEGGVAIAGRAARLTGSSRVEDLGLLHRELRVGEDPGLLERREVLELRDLVVGA